MTCFGAAVTFPSNRDYPEVIALSRAEQSQQPAEHLLLSRSRRQFLMRCCQAASAMAIPAGLRDFTFASAGSSPTLAFNSDLRLNPHYPTQRPLDATLLKAQADSDDFASEKYHDRIAPILAEWSAGLLRSSQDVQFVKKVLAEDFSGASLQPIMSHSLRTGSWLDVRQNKFSAQALGQDAFIHELQSFLSIFSAVLRADFLITGIETSSEFPPELPSIIRTRVRYEIVGTGDRYHREQRVGHWDLEWQAAPASSVQTKFQLRKWQPLEETQSRSHAPVFADITDSALGSIPSYSAQLLRGADHWRTVLDGACGIDIYGHNGVSVADIDNDGLDDLYICQPAGLPNRLYRNRGDGSFEDITETSGLGILDNTACALFADFDNDGLQDVILVRASGPTLFLNQGGGRFRLKPGAFQFANTPQGTFTGAAVADYDRDGWLDIYFCLYVYYQGADQYKYPVPYHDAENGPPNFMMRNNRDGTFRDVTAESGLNQNNTRYSFCCGWNDYNRDGWPDLYVVNDFGRKNLYRNNGNGTFTDVAATEGVEDVGAGMSVCWLDYDNDGAEDIYVGDMWTAAGERISSQENFRKDTPEESRALYRKHAMGNSLFRNEHSGNSGSQTGGLFEDRTATAGVGVGRWAWSSDAFDFDHDGFPDLYIVNGMVSGVSHEDLNSFFWRQVVAKSPDQAQPSHDYEQGWGAINELIRADGTWSGFERNIFYANNRDGTFADVSGAVGLDFIEDGRSFALADFDQDGRLEIFLKNRNAPQLRVFKNVVDGLPPSIAFRLRGTRSNRDAIGAAVIIETEAGRQIQMLQAGSGFLSQHSKEIQFGLGKAQGPVRATVRWPSGLVQNISDLPINHRIWVEEGSEKLKVEPFKSQPGPRNYSSDTVQKPESLPITVETWLLVPVTAPDFSLPSLDGQLQTLSSFRGTSILLTFWAMKSMSCLEDLKSFKRLHSQWSSQGLRLLTVNTDDPENSEKLKALAREHDFSFAILRGSDDTSGIYNILYRYLFDRHRNLGLPTSFLIDPEGNIVKIYQGPLNADQVERDLRNMPRNEAERLARALPFPGFAELFEFGRNNLAFGSVFFQRGYYEQAAASFRLALHDNPSSAEAYYGLGSAQLSLQKTTEARESFERAVKLHASYPDTLANAWNNLGLLDTREGRTDEAIQYFQRALLTDPDHLIALNNLGNAYRLQKNWDAARKTFERALAASSADPEANYGLAMVFAQADDSAHAYEYLQKALKSRPDYPEALNNLGILYLRTERRDQAVSTFEQCIRVAPAFDQSYLNLARVYALEGAPGKARSVLLELLKQHPNHAQAQSMLAQLPQ